MDPQLQGAEQGAITGATAGAAFGPWGAAIGGLGGAAIGYFGTPKRPKYNVQPEYDQNKALAAMSAFGQNAAVRRGEDQLDQDSAEAMYNAQRYSSNTNSLLNTLRSITGSKIQGKRQLAGMDAQYQQQGRQQLAGANVASAEEADKAWNYNVNMPYQLQLEQQQQLNKYGAETGWKFMDYLNAKNTLNRGFMAGYGPAYYPDEAAAGNYDYTGESGG